MDRPARILVVDDTPDNVQLLQLDLEDEGYEVVCAMNGLDALDCAARDNVDVILMDSMMPVMDGLTALRKLKADPKTAPIPVVMVSARFSEADLIEGLDAGAHDYVPKPYSRLQLLARVRSAIRVKEAHDAIQDLNVRLEEARERAEREARFKSEFLSSTSHEIRTPLNGIVGMAELLSETELNPSQVECTDTIQACSAALLLLINDILDHQKIEAGKVELEEIDFDLRRCIEEVCDIERSRLVERNLTIALLLHHDVPTVVRGDPGRLRQVVLNLVNNAIKFTEEGGVTIALTRVDAGKGQDRIRFEVTDTGIGIPEEARERLFRSFSQVNASTTRKYGGTGLGLSICKSLVELMLGEIGVASVEGEGATFFFELPFRAPDILSSPLESEFPSIAGVRAWVVGGNPVVGEMLARDLASWQVEVSVVGTGQEALRGVATLASDTQQRVVVLVDQTLDDIRVDALVASLRDLRGLSLIYLASTPMSGDGRRVQDMGFDGYLASPVKRKQLHDVVSMVLGEQGRSLETGKPELVTRHRVAEQLRRPARILLAEDNRVNQRVAVRMLEKLGYTCEIACDGLAAVHAVESGDYDLVLMDCQMPEMDGFEATAAIRAMPGSRGSIKIIAMTANAIAGDRERCIDAGMDQYLAKPVTLDRLHDALVEALEPAGD